MADEWTMGSRGWTKKRTFEEKKAAQGRQPVYYPSKPSVSPSRATTSTPTGPIYEAAPTITPTTGGPPSSQQFYTPFGLTSPLTEPAQQYYNLGQQLIDALRQMDPTSPQGQQLGSVLRDVGIDPYEAVSTYNIGAPAPNISTPSGPAYVAPPGPAAPPSGTTAPGTGIVSGTTAPSFAQTLKESLLTPSLAGRGYDLTSSPIFQDLLESFGVVDPKEQQTVLDSVRVGVSPQMEATAASGFIGRFISGNKNKIALPKNIPGFEYRSKYPAAVDGQRKSNVGVGSYLANIDPTVQNMRVVRNSVAKTLLKYGMIGAATGTGSLIPAGIIMGLWGGTEAYEAISIPLTKAQTQYVHNPTPELWAEIQRGEAALDEWANRGFFEEMASKWTLKGVWDKYSMQIEYGRPIMAAVNESLRLQFQEGKTREESDQLIQSQVQAIITGAQAERDRMKKDLANSLADIEKDKQEDVAAIKLQMEQEIARLKREEAEWMAQFWLDYHRQKLKIMADASPSNLRFGFLGGRY